MRGPLYTPSSGTSVVAGDRRLQRISCLSPQWSLWRLTRAITFASFSDLATASPPLLGTLRRGQDHRQTEVRKTVCSHGFSAELVRSPVWLSRCISSHPLKPYFAGSRWSATSRWLIFVVGLLGFCLRGPHLYSWIVVTPVLGIALLARARRLWFNLLSHETRTSGAIPHAWRQRVGRDWLNEICLVS